MAAASLDTSVTIQNPGRCRGLCSALGVTIIALAATGTFSLFPSPSPPSESEIALPEKVPATAQSEAGTYPVFCRPNQKATTTSRCALSQQEFDSLFRIWREKAV